MASTIDSIDLGKVQGFVGSKSETIDTQTRVNNDSDDTITTSISGALQTYNVKGTMSANTITLLKTAVDNIRAKINGAQASSVPLVIEVEGIDFVSANVKINSFTYVYDLSQRATVDYTLDVVEG